MTEHTKMITQKYKVTFTTPAFLGNAEQSGQWRTPPFKALLRHWWRVAVAREHDYKYKEIREKEGELFGNAWLDSGATKSRVRMRLDKWTEGNNRWQSLPKIGDDKNQVAADLYLGYGPVEYKKATQKTSLKKAALQAKNSAELSLAVPEDYEHKIIETLALIDCFGALGGRSRNGWGSVSLAPQDDSPVLSINPRKFSAELDAALGHDWPHAIGSDDKGLLIWETSPLEDWQSAMTELAKLRKGLNTQFKNDRKWLNYPVTKLENDNWHGNKRLPSSLRFKVIPAQGGVKGIVFHLPCLPPKGFNPEPEKLIKIWKEVHKALDDNNNYQLTRQGV